LGISRQAVTPPSAAGLRVARHRVGGDLQRAQAHRLQQLQHQVIGRRFHRHRVAGPGHRAQAEHHRLGAGIGRHQFLGRQRIAPFQGAPRDRAHQWRFGQVGVAAACQQLRLAAGDAGVKAAQARRQQQFRRRQGRAQTHHTRRLVGTQHLHQAAADADFHRSRRRRPGQRRRIDHGRRPPAHVIAGLRPRLDHAAAFQRAQRLHHGRDRQRALPRQVAHRRQAVARPQLAAADQRGEFVGEVFVEHRGWIVTPVGAGRPAQ
jgi:hypothetical protein